MSGRRQIYEARGLQGVPAYDAPRPDSEVIAEQRLEIAILKGEIARLGALLEALAGAPRAPARKRKAEAV